MSTDTLIRPQIGDPALDQGEGRKTHIVKAKDGKDAAALVMEAMCGHIWVPSRDPRKYPMCQACKEAVDVTEGEGYSDGID